jgi:hypothetical protein
MSSEKSKNLFEKARGMRDSVLEDLAKVTLAWTSSHAYQSVNAAVSRPTLLAAAIFRKATESAMADMLARLNMPSREDVLSLSQRLTRIEMVLDDLGAAMDQVRRSSGKQRPAAREREGNGEGRPAAAVTMKEG